MLSRARACQSLHRAVIDNRQACYFVLLYVDRWGVAVCHLPRPNNCYCASHWSLRLWLLVARLLHCRILFTEWFFLIHNNAPPLDQYSAEGTAWSLHQLRWLRAQDITSDKSGLVKKSRQNIEQICNIFLYDSNELIEWLQEILLLIFKHTCRGLFIVLNWVEWRSTYKKQNKKRRLLLQLVVVTVQAGNILS